MSSSVARFREDGLVVTETDPADRRRTLVRPAPGVQEKGRRNAESMTVDGVLAEALGVEAAEVAELVATLDSLARRLTGAPT